MSKIMDLYAEVNGIDDLAPVYNRKFYDSVQKEDERRAISQIITKARKEDVDKLFDWLYENAEFGCGYDEEGHKEIYFENYIHLCDEIATNMVDAYIEEQHFDVTDEQYSRMIDIVGDEIANLWCDLEDEVIEKAQEDQKERWHDLQSYNNLTLPKE